MYIITNLEADGFLFILPDYEELQNYCKFKRFYDLGSEDEPKLTITNSLGTPLYYAFKAPYYSSAMEKIEEENQDLVNRAKSKLTEDEMKALDIDP